MAACVLPFLPRPDPASWPFICGSVATQLVYVNLLALAYRTGDMSLTYPVMRGVAPLIVAVASGPIIGESLTPGRWLGVGLISLGVLGMAFFRTTTVRNGTAVGFALLNACAIAGYTVIDGLGVRRSGAPISYAFTTFVGTTVPLLVWVGLRRRQAFVAYAVDHWPVALVGGAATLGSYSLTLWAMTVAPVAAVAALRETAILFGAAISVVVLKERITPARLAATGLIVAGAAVIRGL